VKPSAVTPSRTFIERSYCHDTPTTDFVLDLLDFMEEKLREALRDETSRVGAVNEAAGAVPVLRDRPRENELVQTQFMLVLGNELFEPQLKPR
jgi:hypothetical protein